MKRLNLEFLCSLFISFIACNVVGSAQQSSDLAAQNSASQNDRPIILSVVVANKKGHYLEGLGKSNFAVYDNKSPVEINFISAKDEPASVGVIFDLSNSVAEYGREDLKAAAASLSSFIKAGNLNNEYFVMGFGERTQLFVDWTPSGKAIEALNTTSLLAKMGANTALYDACHLGVEKMKSASHLKQVILLISDGQDNASHHTFKEIRELLKASNVVLYSVGISGWGDYGSSLAMEGQAILNELSTVTGGMAFFPESRKKIDETFEHLGLELRQQYVLSFVPSVAADGKWHQLKIRVTTPQKIDLYVRSREGYYAIKNSNK